MGVTIKNKLVLKDIGNPKLLTTLPETETKLVLGKVIGIANKVSIRTAPNGTDTYEGLSGTFKGVPADAERDTVQSGTVYFPDGIHKMIASAVEAQEEAGERNPNVQFAFEVSVVRAANPQGYSWAFEPLLAPTVADPLAALEASIPERVSLAAPGEKFLPGRATAPAKGKAA